MYYNYNRIIKYIDFKLIHCINNLDGTIFFRVLANLISCFY